MKACDKNLFLLPVLMAGLCLILAESAQAQERWGDYNGFEWWLNGNTIEINDNDGSLAGAVAIPSSIPIQTGTNPDHSPIYTYYPVTSIGISAFYGCSSLTSVTIPSSVTSIGDNAFSGCSSLTSVTIPDSVTSILEGTFYGCTSLTSVTIPNNVTSIGGGAFWGCTSLTSVTIPNNVTNIGSNAFRECSRLTSVTIGNSVTSIGDDAFPYCTSLNNVVIGNSVTSIGGAAFAGCTNLPSITIPNSVTNIGGGAFSECSSLTSVTIGNSVTSIGRAAFEGDRLTSVTIPSSVTSIEYGAFYYCFSLTNVCFEGNAPSAGIYIFLGDPVSFIYYVNGTTGWGPTFSDVKTIPCTSCASTVTLSGHVYSACDRPPIALATVNVDNYFSAITDINGHYSLSGIPPGTYPTTISKTNYYTINITVIIPSGSTTVTQDFTLTRLPALDYFGVGVNWRNVPPDPNPTKRMNNVSGDVDAADLYLSLWIDLSPIFNLGSMIVSLDAANSTDANLNIINADFNTFMGSVCSNDTVVFYASSHGNPYTVYNGPSGFTVLLSSDYATHEGLSDRYIANLLNSLPSSTRKVVILDSCHSGGIGEYLANSVANISILVASSATGNSQSKTDGTGIFTHALTTELDMGIVDLNRIANDIKSDRFNTYADLVGQDLALRDFGSAVFMGLEPQLWEGGGFTGNLASNTVNIVQLPPKVSQATIGNGSFQMTLTNMPTVGAIAIELSTNLISWLQVSFYPAAGTNLHLSFPTTNYTAAYFRTKVVQ
jgi:hypothetical protein